MERERKTSKLTRTNSRLFGYSIFKGLIGKHSQRNEKKKTKQKKHGMSVSIRPHYTLRKALVHPIVEKENAYGVMYEIPCASIAN